MTWRRMVFVIGTLSMWLPGPTLAWWNGDWEYRLPLAVTAPEDLAQPVPDVPVLVRLQFANFGYFFDTAPDGADLRLIAGDDRSELAYDIDTYDPTTGIGLLWVRLPALEPGRASSINLYFGNPEAPPGRSGAAYDGAERLVLHFGETDGPPRDASAFANHLTTSTAAQGQMGFIGRGIHLDGSQGLSVPASVLNDARELTVSAWIRPTAVTGAARLLSVGDPAGGSGLLLRLDDGRLTARLSGTAGEILLSATTPLQADRWYHLALTLGRGAALLLDGAVVASSEVPPALLQGELVVGAAAGGPGFVGDLDELRVSHVARRPEWLAAAVALQQPDTPRLLFGEVEASRSGVSAYGELLRTLTGLVSVDGWIIIGIIAVIGVMSIEVIVDKTLTLGRVSRANRHFLKLYAANPDDWLQLPAADTDPATPLRAATSPLQRLQQRAITELVRLLRTPGQTGFGRLTAESLEVLRSAIDSAIVEEASRLDRGLVLITMAVSAAPFLGLLGTVFGVMITFASVAAEGDVDVNTIAPGVASAMSTTVAGLVVAIPCLFAYNGLASQVRRLTDAMDLFANELLGRFVHAYGKQGGTDAAAA
ncbi:MAG: Tol-Pal system protein TolQ [Immundisolibacter sp.]|nr:Tol-Pal system protein TolQ [Immundisolibacter sp.]